MEDKDDRFVTYTQAAHVLGYKTYRSILNLIEDGHLQTYSTSPNSRNYLKLSEVLNLAVPQKFKPNRF